jgi:diaminopimelate epimerase
MIPFVKMHGAGNDFVMIDSRNLTSGGLSTENIAALCHRRTGIGADGLIIIAPTQSQKTDFQMIYFNADGGEAEMCGNGARCSMAFAQAIGLVKTECLFDTYSGILKGKINSPGDVTVSLPPWQNLGLDFTLEGSPFTAHHQCNTGVPHVVIPVPDVETIDILQWGSFIRNHEHFSPAGTNVNWVSAGPDNGELLIRTFERGVEDETMACGTGASAAAVVMCHLDRAQSPVSIRTRGGDLLQVTVDKIKGTLLLRGPAAVSFHGEVACDD